MAAVRLFLSIDTKTALLLEDSAICKAESWEQTLKYQEEPSVFERANNSYIPDLWKNEED